MSWSLLSRWFDPQSGVREARLARWIFLRALAAIYFSAFYSLLFQIKGLIGPHGIEPASLYLRAIEQNFRAMAWWHAPSLFWISASSVAMIFVTWLGIVASTLAFANVWPRLSLLVCFVCFLSFVSTAGDFSSYQSDGMLLEAGFISLFFAPSGMWPGLGVNSPSRASLWLLRWEWFRIYFESGIVKELSGDPQWRNFTAMDEYYQNSPLPTWIGWYVQHLPHWFHAATAVMTLVMEFVLVLMVFFPRRVRLICFFIVTPWEVGVILTGNYAFLNYLVLALGILLIDDAYLERVVPARFRYTASAIPARERPSVMHWIHIGRVAVSGVVLLWIGYVTTAELVNLVLPRTLPMTPANVLEPFRIANQYGLFAVMTRGRYEIEFQGSNDGQNWRPYLFRNKPQLLDEAPRIYAPYQPRFDWNLWFASLSDWRQNEFVAITEERLLENDRDVIALFRRDPFDGQAPQYVRAVLYQYWMTSMEEKRRTGNWWRRAYLGLYAPEIERTADGKLMIAAPADPLPAHD